MERRIEIHQDLRRNPAPTENHAEEYEIHQRGKTAERALIGGLAQGAIKAHNGRAYLIDSWLWNGHPHFRYNLRLSIVRLPSAITARRHEPARINEEEFDAWCRTLDVLTPSAEQALSAKEQYKIFFRAQLRASTDRTKADYLREAQAHIPKLTKRTFEAVWAELAPDSLRRAGRRS